MAVSEADFNELGYVWLGGSHQVRRGSGDSDTRGSPRTSKAVKQPCYPLSSRYEQTRDMNDLEAAIKAAEAAVMATPEDHPVRAEWLNNLGCYLSRRYERTRDMHDLAAAIKSAEAVVEATPEDHAGRARRFNNLGNHLSWQYDRSGDMHNLVAAIKSTGTAVKATPMDHLNRADR